MMLHYVTGLIGMWVVSDGILSWTLYLNAPSYEGSHKQTFWRDHWVRAVRILCGITLIIIGGVSC
jgi:hypothetical protein